jgi:hypothetical protein
MSFSAMRGEGVGAMAFDSMTRTNQPNSRRINAHLQLPSCGLFLT